MDEQLTSDTPFICETVIWTNCTGVVITEYVPRCGVPPEGFARFRMGVTLSINGQPAVTKTVPIDAETIEEAFMMAPAVVAKAGPEMEEALKGHIQSQQKQHIITAAQARQLGTNGNRQQRRAEEAARCQRMRFDG